MDPSTFVKEFGAPVSELSNLIAAKSVTISQLMDLVPTGTIDPTPFLYNTAMYAAAGILAASTVANALIKPVDKKFHMKS